MTLNISAISGVANTVQSPAQSIADATVTLASPYVYSTYVPGAHEPKALIDAHAVIKEAVAENKASKSKKLKKGPKIKPANPHGMAKWEILSDQYMKEKELKPKYFLVRKDFLTVLGDWNMAAILTQIVYWYTPVKRKNGNPAYGKLSVKDREHTGYWIAKTAEEWEAETTVPKWSVYKAIEGLRDLGIIHTFSAMYGKDDNYKKRIHVSLVAAEGAEAILGTFVLGNKETLLSAKDEGESE